MISCVNRDHSSFNIPYSDKTDEYSKPEVRRADLDGRRRSRDKECSKAKPGCEPSLYVEKRAVVSEFAGLESVSVPVAFVQCCGVGTKKPGM